MLLPVADELKPGYLLTGSDRPKIERALRRLRGRFGEEAVERLSAREASGEDAVAACNALGLFAAGGRLVLVEEVDRWKAADARAVAAYLEAPAPATVLALVGEEVKRDSPLAKACAKAGSGAVLVYDVRRRELPKWVAEQFGLLGARADAAACGLLVEIAGEDTRQLSEEVHKLAAWAGGDPIDERAVASLAIAGEKPPWLLTDAWGRRDVAGVLAASETLLQQAAGARSGELLRLSAAMAGHVRLVRDCLRLAAEGVRPAEAAQRLRRKEFPVRKAFAQAEHFTEGELREAVVRLAALDLALKGGSRLPPELELERTLVAITRRAGEPAGVEQD